MSRKHHAALAHRPGVPRASGDEPGPAFQGALTTARTYQGLNLIDAGHFPTEDVVCQEIVRRLRETFPELEVTKSAVHGDAVKFYMR